MRKKLKLAVIGCGRMGSRRMRTIVDHPDTELISAVDVNEDIARESAKRFECNSFCDFKDAINDDDVDCVVVSVPNKFHAMASIAALENGKHVFCEKPLARNPKEAFTIVEAADKNGCFLKTGSNLRCFPSVEKAKELIDEDEIGEILYLRGWVGNSGRHLKGSWYSNVEMSGGGTFLDNGVHLLDLTRMFLGEIETCFGEIKTLYWPISPLEDNGFGIFHTSNGKMAFIQSSWTEWAGYMYMEIYGSDGSIYVNNRNHQCITTLMERSGEKRIFDYSLLPPQSYEREFEEYVKALLEDRQPLASGFDGMRAVQMAYGVYESSRTKRVVHI